ncbi:PIG-L deacetylase family protein [Halomonas sp. PR-M31]|uniref:PIG-L deacetylase family protein n=1 Tax=Halomonas sp. PR-M31 TaxID=1471202 RepID=UPI0006512446|nr:PIG-L family deacetylase [Halomonas sp. PR-M31]
MADHYATLKDYRHTLIPDCECSMQMRHDSLESLTANANSTATTTRSWLLPIRVQYRAMGCWREPSIEIQHPEQSSRRQYFEPGSNGERYLELGQHTGISPQGIKLTARDCRFTISGAALGFECPDLSAGPLLIVAPHPDDAELAAFGLYSSLPEQSWILTLTAGESLGSLRKQYLRGLDDKKSVAVHRKGAIRSWDAAHVASLGGVPANQCLMLGYADGTLSTLLEDPKGLFTPYFRRYNVSALPSDTWGGKAQGESNIVDDIRSVLQRVQPATIVMTDPVLDPHRDHRAAALLTWQAIQSASHSPDQLLLYANHFHGTNLFPYGPPDAISALPPPSSKQHEANLPNAFLGAGYYSHPLSQSRCVKS